MPDLQFQVVAIEAADSSGSSETRLKLAITNRCPEEQVHSIALSIQLQIEPARRRYTEMEKQALHDVFGEPSRWSSTVRPLYWTTLNATIPAFVGDTEIEFPIPNAFEPDVAAARYMSGLQGGEVPVLFLFSGRVLYFTATSLQMSPIPWSQEATCGIPVELINRNGLRSLGIGFVERGAA
jgi:hypothetical protein